MTIKRRMRTQMKATSEVSGALVISVLSLSPAERCHCSIYRSRYQCIGTLSRDNDEYGRGKVLMKSNFVFFQASADNRQVQCFTLYHRHIECFHMTSRRPYWCPKTMKRRPCWCPKPILWELNSFLMQTLSFVPINLHRCWPRE